MQFSDQYFNSMQASEQNNFTYSQEFRPNDDYKPQNGEMPLSKDILSQSEVFVPSGGNQGGQNPFAHSFTSEAVVFKPTVFADNSLAKLSQEVGEAALTDAPSFYPSQLDQGSQPFETQAAAKEDVSDNFNN